MHTVTHIDANKTTIAPERKRGEPMVELTTMEFYPSQADAAVATGILQTTISYCARNKTQTRSGLKFRFWKDLPDYVLEMKEIRQKDSKAKEDVEMELNRTKVELNNVKTELANAQVSAEASNATANHLLELMRQRKAHKEAIAREQEALRLVEEAIANLDI